MTLITGRHMIDDKGSFRVDVEVGHPAEIGERQVVHRGLVDTGAELSVFPASVLGAVGIVRRRVVRFRRADGSAFERWIGSGKVYVAGTDAIDFRVR